MKKVFLVSLIGVAAILSTPLASAQNDATGTIQKTPVPYSDIQKTISSDDSTTVQGSGKEYLSCMSKATDIRESALLSALQAYHSSIISAHSSYKSAIVSAWNSSEDKNTVQTALNNAQKSLKESLSAAEKTQAETKQTVHKQFSTEKSACLKLSTATKPTTGDQQSFQSLYDLIKKLQAQIEELKSGYLTKPQTNTTQPKIETPQPNPSSGGY